MIVKKRKGRYLYKHINRTDFQCSCPPKLAVRSNRDSADGKTLPKKCHWRGNCTRATGKSSPARNGTTHFKTEQVRPPRPYVGTKFLVLAFPGECLRKKTFVLFPQAHTRSWTCRDLRISGQQRAWKAYTFIRRRRSVPIHSRNITNRVM